MTESDRTKQMFDQLFAHSDLVNERLKECVDEESTKYYLIQPFLALLGYEGLDVQPERPIPVVNGKVDYALKRSGEPVILVEAKAYDSSLGHVERNQLKKYFPHIVARYGLLTDGVKCIWYRKRDGGDVSEDDPFLIHDLRKPTDLEAEWLAAVSHATFDANSLRQLATTMRVEGRLHAWVARVFVQDGATEGDLAPLIDVVASVPVELTLLRSAAKRAMKRVLAEHAAGSVQPIPDDDVDESKPLKHNNRTGDHLDLGDGRFLDAKKLARAWRVNEGDWNEEPNAATVTTKVISWLLEQSTNHDDEDSLAESSRYIATQAELGSRKLKPISDSGHLYVDTNIPNSEKVRLIETVVKWIQSNADQPGNVVKGFSLETWIPTGSPKPKRQKSR